MTWKQFRGRWLPGRIYHTYHNLVCFDPCRFHQPQQWEGKRITISAYTVNCYDNCSQAHLALLQALGFPLPHDGVRAQPEGGEGACGNVLGSGATKSLRRQKGALRVLCCSGFSERDQVGDSSIPGEDQTLESPQVAGGEGRDLVHEGQGHVGDRAVPGEDQTLESPQVAGGEGRGCMCKGYEVDPSLCMCKGYEVDPSLCVCKGYEVDPSPEHGPQVFYIGDAVSANVEDGTKDQAEGEPEDAWLREEWGAYGPPELTRLMAVNEEDESSYHLVGAESPLRVGWDLLGEYVDGLRMALVLEEYAERDHLLRRGEEGDECSGLLHRWVQDRAGLEDFVKSLSDSLDEDVMALRKMAPQDEEDVPLHTKTVPNEIVRREIKKWVPSMAAEYEALVRENDAVEPFPEETLELWKKEGQDFDLVPGKTVHTIKAFSGRLKTRAVICGNFLGQCFTRDQKYASGADSVLIRLVLRECALQCWSLCVIDVRTAFLLAPLLFQEERPTLVQVPKMFLLGGVCKETVWRVKRALYGMVTSPKSWEVYRNKTMAEMRGKVKEGEVTLVPSQVDGSLWYAMVSQRRVGLVICYVDDLLIAGEKDVAEEVTNMFRKTWKCSEPQWDDISFNGFEIKRTSEGLVLTQDSYVKDLLERYKNVDGFEEVPAPLQLKPEEFEIKENEDVAEFVRAAQVIAGEIQWLAGRCRPELMYATNLLSQAISRCPKEAVYRGGHRVRYLKRYPAGGLVYSSQPVKEKDARLSCRGPLLEGYSDASFAPSAERSQQCVLVFASGGLVAWCSSRQPFVTMSTAESELVAICEMTTCLKSLEQLAAEVSLGKASDFVKVMKVLFSDSQSALSVCRCAAGSWRTRHLRIRGNLVRELLDQADWTSFHLDGVTMTADIGTKALPADRFGMLVDRMRMTRTRCTTAEAREVKTLNLQCARRLVLLLCLASLVDQVEAADAEQVDYVYYGFLTGVVVVILIVYEFIKWGLQEVRGWCRVRGEATRIKRARSTTTTTRARPSTSSSSSSTSASEEMMSLRRRRPPTPPVPEDRLVPDDEGAYSFVTPSGDRDRWEVDYEREVAIHWHAKPRQHLFVPGHCSGGPELSRLTGERTTYAKFPSGQVRMLKDNYLQLAKPSPVLADREWKGRTELKMHPAAKAATKGKMR